MAEKEGIFHSVANAGRRGTLKDQFIMEILK
jgi:hypothetical protein